MSTTGKRVYVVTGANRGLGFALTREILKQDSNNFVVMGCKNTEKGWIAAKSFESEGLSSRYDVQELDITCRDSISRAANTVHKKFGSLEAVVCNAAIALDLPWCSKPIPKECAVDTLRCNFFGTVWTCEIFLPIIRSGGRVVVISSGASTMNLEKSIAERREELLSSSLTLEDLTQIAERFTRSWDQNFPEGNLPKLCPREGWWLQAYGFSKALVNAYTVNLAKRAPALLVNACTPGFIQTDMTLGYDGFGDLTTPSIGATTPLHLCIGDLASTSGAFWRDAHVVPWFP